MIQSFRCSETETASPAGFLLNLQSAYDLEVAQDKPARMIEREVRPGSFAAANAPS
ncbi:MAG: hypothetical protein WCA76_22225 [Candidatus Sulfotelmatobacter sp.]|jgi:plasmid maintenance system antidote protein VapI